MAEPVTDWMTPREAARHLNLSERTVMHWIAQSWVVAEAEEHGQTRRHRVSLASVQAHLVRRQLGARSGAAAELPAEIERLLDRIDELERFKKQVEQTAIFRAMMRSRSGLDAPPGEPPTPLLPLAGKPPYVPPPRADTKREGTYTSVGETFPAGWLSLDEFLAMHAMPRSTVTSPEAKHQAAVHALYHVKGEAPDKERGWKRGRNWVTMAVSPDQRAAILARWPPRQRCKVVDCPCRSQDADLADLDRELATFGVGEEE
ncbi:MAG: helix-turn-helix domain-containing protein [Ktedonobacterales bacterium]|nr:helix-turn-helix domain-containing protein [Ktedonobacterales bacterium]